MSCCLVECSVPSVVYMRGETVINPTVNMALVMTVTSGKYSWYPDNIGLAGLQFALLGGGEVQWAFQSIRERDAEYERLREMFAPGKMPICHAATPDIPL